MTQQTDEYHDQGIEFASKLHDGREFEIFTALENRTIKNIRCYSCNIFENDDTSDSQSDADYQSLKDLNNEQRGIWFTANSMKFGKRQVEFITNFNALVIDLDAGKEGEGNEQIENRKKDHLSKLLNLQLPPTVIVETKNGLQPYWFLLEGEISDNETYIALQQSMVEKLGADRGAIGGERLWRLPGFYHWKDVNNPFLCKIIHSNYNKKYTLKELIRKFGGKRKHKELRKKSVGKKYSGQPIMLEEFKHPGNVANIARSCQVFNALEQKKAPTHQERFALLSVYINLGKAGLEHFREIAQGWNDYNEEVTEYAIAHMLKKCYKPVTCQYLIDKGICTGKCFNILDKHSPISFYYNETPTLPRLFDNRNFLDVQGLPIEVDHIDVQQKLIKCFNGWDQTLSDIHKEIFQTAAAIMSFRVPDEKPIVIPFIPGGGKTTFIIEYLRYMTSIDSQFGAVLAVERQDTINDIAQKINTCYFAGRTYETNTAYPMLGYSSDDCKKGYETYKPSQCKTCDVPFIDCRVKYNFARQKRCPIVVISHARLFEMSDRDDTLSNLRYWEKYERYSAGDEGPLVPRDDLDEILEKSEYELFKYGRRLLIIDEKPKLVDNVATNSVMWDQLSTDVQEFTPDYTQEVQNAITMVRDHYANPDEYHMVNAIDSNFRWSRDFVEAWKDQYLGDHPEYPTFLRCIITEGGLYSKENNSVSLTHYSNTYWGDYNTVIFDGTAMTDPDYRDDRFVFWDVPHLRPYHNLTINVCMEQNLSKTFYQNHTDFVGKFCEDIIDIAASGMTYVVAYKGYEAEFNSHLQNVNHIKLEHWGNTKGRNDLKECANIVFCGLLHKGEPYYHSKAIAVHGRRENERSFQCITTGKVRRFKNLDTECTKVYDFLTESIQDIFRTGLRDHYSNTEINVYLCTRDAILVNLLVDFFPGCNQNRDWAPKALLNNREKFREFVEERREDYKTNAKLVKAFIAKGNSLTTDDIVDVLEIDRKNAARYIK